MANVAGKDGNGVSTKLALLNTDGATIQPINANPTSHGIKYSDGSTGSDNGGHVSRDTNFVPVIWAKSNAGDGAIVPLYATSLGELLIKST